MKVAGIDISLTGTGVALHQAGGLTFVREFGENGHKGDPLTKRMDRLDRLLGEVLDQVCSGGRPDLAVFEAHDFGMKVSASSHDRSGVWWLVAHELRMRGTKIAQATPQTLKMYQTGSGGASKDAMLVAAVRRYPTVDIMSNNQADAMAALSMGVRHLELAPLEDAWNAKMAQAMSKAEWPA